MKRLLCIFFALLLLAGCGTNPPATMPPETTVPVTEPSIPWIDEMGRAWDREGVLRELPLTIYDGMHYTNALEFDGDLLLWSIDNHLRDVYTLELCLLELDSGIVTASAELDFAEYVTPQVLGQTLFICDNVDYRILALDKDLRTVKQWNPAGYEGNFIMGAGEILYIYDWNGNVTRLDLKSGESAPLLEDIYIDYFTAQGNHASVQYIDPETGAQQRMLIDLYTGEFLQPPVPGNYTDLFCSGGSWLCEIYRDGYTAYVGASEADFLRADLGYNVLRLLEDGRLLMTSEEGCILSIHDLSGKIISRATLTESPYSYDYSVVIPSDAFGGYFLILTDHSSALRLLYWDVSRGKTGEHISFEPIPEPAEAEAAARSRAAELSRRYGLHILVGADCRTDFLDFTAEQVTDWEAVDYALNVLENALEKYPEGFFRQLRYGDVHRTEIHLTGPITATTAEYTDTYEAFVQENYDCHVMVADISLADESTYYHEFSHIIDSFLEWDAMNREDALFSEDTWNGLNPGWFPGYTWDYSWQQDVQDYNAFVGTYSTINPTEDRAMILEDAMMDYGQWTFEDAYVLLEKLEYYCLCIRDAFDTTLWPDTVLWEQYLP